MNQPKKEFERVALRTRDFEILQFLFESKIVTKDQIQLYFFNNAANGTVNRRLRKILSLDLIKRVPLETEQKTIYGYTITQKGLNKVKHLLPYGYGKINQSDCPIHDIVLVDIRKAFENRNSIKSYYTENVLQTCPQFKNNMQFQPFIELNSDGVVLMDTKIGILDLAIEFDAHQKNNERYRNKLNDYYFKRKIEGVLYICANQYILNALLKIDYEVSHRHRCNPKMYFALLNDVIHTKNEMTFKNVDKYILQVC